MKNFYRTTTLVATSLFLLLANPDITTGQIIPDNSLPNNSIITPNGSAFKIDGGTTAGNNLFHSFQEFGVATGKEAFFNNATTIDNIITRVTGGNISNIDGLIRANGSANLFLLNPNGIIFGPNARLDIGGSFLGSTANSLRFEDGSFYSATEANAPPLLTVKVPLGLQVGSNPAPITVRGPGHQIEFDLVKVEFIKANRPVGLEVPPGQTLALVGGDIILDGGNLTAPDGRIETWSVRNTEVSLDTSSTLQLSHLGTVRTDWGTVTLQQSASMDASGTQGGAIQIRGRGLTLRDASNIFSDTRGSGKGQGISVETTEFVELLGLSAPGQLIIPGIQTFALGSSDNISGDITVKTERLLIDGGDTISSYPAGNGSRAGDIAIQARDVTVQNFMPFPPFLASNIGTFIINDVDENSGDIIIDAERVAFLNGGIGIAEVLVGSGIGGDLVIRASESLEIRGTRPDGVPSFLSSAVFIDGNGQGGNIFIDTGKLVLAEGGQINTGVSRAGQAGDIEIQAGEILISDAVLDSSNGTISGINAAVGEGATGNSGNITIQVDRLRLFDGGQITSANEGSGRAGSINIQVRDLEVQGSGSLRAIDRDAALEGRFGVFLPENGRLTPSAIAAFATGEGAAGSVNITSDRLSVRDGAQINVSSQDLGDSGNLNITAGNIFLDRGGRLRAEVNGGSQGNINLNVSDALILRRNSSLAANATGASTGGNIDIDTNVLTLLQNSSITANAVRGNGGNIAITTRGIFVSPNSSITASSQRGIDGVVQINNPDVDSTQGLVELSQEPVEPSDRIVTGCGVDPGSQFIITGRGGLPPNPSQQLTGDRPWTDLRDLSAFRGEVANNSASESETRDRPLVEANGWIIHPDGTVELVAITSNSPPERLAHKCAARQFPHGQTSP